MDVLYLAHRIPYPPNKGDKLRSFRQIERLSSRHRVVCACFIDNPADHQYVRSLRAYCDDVIAINLLKPLATIRGLKGLLRGRTVTESYYRHRSMAESLRKLGTSRQFDCVVAFSSSMVPYARMVKAPWKVLDLCDLDSLKWSAYAEQSRGISRLVYRTEGRRLAERELEWIREFDATILITEDEAACLPESVDRTKLHVVPNGVYLPPLRRMNSPGGEPCVGFIGNMDYRPNVDAVTWFVESIWPGIKSHCEDAVFRIVGRNPVRPVQRLARIEGVHVVGEVDDVQDELQRFDVYVAPMRIARGMQNKVLEAMAGARPVVLSSAAAEGIGGVDGADYYIADAPQQFARIVGGLLLNASSRRAIGLRARRFVDQHHRWEPRLSYFERIVTGDPVRVARSPFHGIPMSKRAAEVVPMDPNVQVGDGTTASAHPPVSGD